MTFEEYVQSRLPSLLQLAGILSGDRHLAEDVVQDVLLRVAQQWSRIEARTSTDAYVRRMIVNEYLSWRRKWARIVPRAEVDPGVTVADHAERHADHDDLAQRLAGLPARQRAVLVLRYYEGLSDHDIGQVLDCSNGTVRSHASRALAALRINTEQTLQPAREDH